MIKGYQRKMICLRSPDSELFCEAYFVLRDGGEQVRESDMVEEANRLVDSCVSPRVSVKKSHPVWHSLFFAVSGAIFGAAITFLISIL